MKPNRLFEFLSAMNDNKYYVRLNGELLEFTRNTLSDRMYCLSISLDDFDELANFVYTERRHKNQKEVTNADS